MQKKIYSLNTIGKLLTYIPQIFLIILATFFIIISIFMVEYKKNNDIKLLLEQQKYIKQEILNKYINSVKFTISEHLLNTEQELKKNLYLIKGLQANTPNIQELINKHIKDIESKKSIKFIVFDQKLNTLYGFDIIKDIEQLIFNQPNDPAYIGLTLLYLSSQGPSTSFSWKDDVKQTIQLSFIETTFDNKYFIGTFSYVDDQKNLIQNAFLNTIRKDKNDSNNYYFWIYNEAKKNFFNLQNQKKWEIMVNRDKNDKIQYNFEKHNLIIGITQKPDFIENKITEIKIKSSKSRNLNITIIVISTLFLMAFFTIFSSFIKDIFSSYNRRFENKNKQLKRLKQRYELAIIASNDGLWDRNLKTDSIFFSKKWLDMLGYKPGEISSYNHWIELLHEKDKDVTIQTINGYIQSNSEKHLICEYRLKMKNGNYKWILARGKVFEDNLHKQKRLLMMTMDIDEKKEITKHLKSLVKKEVAKNEEKQKLLIQQNKLASMGEMIGSIAHQWRQPLNNISLLIHFIRDNVRNAKFQEQMLDTYIDKVKEQITYMSETIDDFRNFYKPSKNSSTFSIQKAINSTIDIMQTQIKNDNINVIVQGEPLLIEGYENEFKQAILNILTNAKDAIKSRKEKESDLQGEINIDIIHKNNNTIITISNNGGNASSQVFERMFEPYFTTKFEDKGTGIGLYMTKTIIETSMHGKIVAHNIKDGMQFEITI